MAKVIKLGAGKAKQAGSHVRARAKSKPFMGKPQKSMPVQYRPLSGQRSNGGPSSSNARANVVVKVRRMVSDGKAVAPGMGHVVSHRQMQKTFDGSYGKLSIPGAQPAVKQKSGASSSAALVRPAMTRESRTNTLAIMGKKVSAIARQVAQASPEHPWGATRAADKVGKTRTNKITKVSSTKQPSVPGPKITYQKRAAKSAGKKPYVI